jgi:ubiquitin carboxyl-terminal hydrolase L3
MSERKKVKREETTTVVRVGDTSVKEEQWYPLESDCSVMNALVKKMGFDTSLYEFTDIISIEPSEIKEITQTVVAVMMLLPLTQVQKQYNQHEQHTPTTDGIWFIRDRVDYACGTIALLHAVLNAPNGVKSVAIYHDSWLHSFYEYCTVDMHPNAKADVFEGDKTIKMLHNKAARNLEECLVAQPTAIKDEQLPIGVTSGSESTVSKDEQLQGNSKSESQTDEINGHFITMVHVNGGLYELDGQKDGPVRHGDTTQETLLEDTCEVVKKIMKRDPNEWSFSIMALVQKKE